MSELDWSTPDGLAAIKDHLSAKIEGWRPPVAYAVGLSSASSSAEWDFGHVNAPGAGTACRPSCWRPCWDTTGRPPPGADDLAARRRRRVARAGRGLHELDHPNLAAWRVALAEAASNPARTLVAVFVADLDDPVASEADGAMRATFEGHTPSL